MIITGTWTPIKKFIHNIHDVYCVVKIKVFFSYIDISLIQTCYPVSSCLCNNFCSNLRVPAGVSIITDNLVAKISIPDRVRNSPWLISEIRIITGGDLDTLMPNVSWFKITTFWWGPQPAAGSCHAALTTNDMWHHGKKLCFRKAGNTLPWASA